MSDKAQISRRDVLALATAVVGGAVTGISPLALAEQWAGGNGEAAPGFLGPDRFRWLGVLADTVIPPTDTPGAVEAGVPGFIDFLLSEWASDQTRLAFSGAVNTVDERARQAHGQPFDALDAPRRENLLSILDREYAGRPREGFGLLKSLVVFGYYTSEIGANRELRWDPVPGAYGCRPMAEEERDWATNGWRHEL